MNSVNPFGTSHLTQNTNRDSFNVSTNRPMIPNAGTYYSETKYVSIHSEDRDYLKYPNAAEFEVLLPQEYLNVATVRLSSWSFPSNYNVFSVETANVVMTFQMIQLYNPAEHGTTDVLLEGIYAALLANQTTEYDIYIESGFYNPTQMANELTNKFNEAVTNIIVAFFDANPEEYAEAKALFTEYNRFQIEYNSVSQNLWFGNTADQFILTNSSNTIGNNMPSCNRRNYLPQYANWGLPAYLGFNRCDVTALTAAEYLSETPENNAFISSLNVPRFYYVGPDDPNGNDGYWLLPSAPGATVYFLRAPYKISFMGQAYMYMEIDGMNFIDEFAPWNLSDYTVKNNQTNGRVNSAFAKIPIPTTPISQWFDNNGAGPYKYWNPPAERLSRLKVKFRYHNGQLVNFGEFEYSFMLELNLLNPQQDRGYKFIAL